MFFMEARKFYFGFFLREFDIDLLVKLQSLKVIDRAPYMNSIEADKNFDRNRLNPRYDDQDRFQVILQASD